VTTRSAPHARIRASFAGDATPDMKILAGCFNFIAANATAAP